MSIGPKGITNTRFKSPFLAASFLKVCMVTLLAGVTVFTYTILPRELRHLGMGDDRIGVVMGGFFLGLLLGIRPGEIVIRRWGIRVLVVGGLLLMGVSGILFMTATAIIPLWAARVTQGLGWSGVVVGSITWVTALIPNDRTAQGIGLHGLLFQISQAGGPWLAETVVQRYHFRALFALGITLTALSILCATLTPTPPRSRINSSTADSSQRRTRALRGAVLCLAVGFGCVMSFLADYVPAIGTDSVGGFFGAYVMVNILVRGIYGARLDRGNRITIINIASVSQAAVLAGLAMALRPWQLVPLGAIFGFAIALYLPVFQALFVDLISDRGRAVATFQFWYLLGATLASTLLGFVAAITGYRMVFGVSAVIASLAVGFLRLDKATLRRAGPV